MIVPFLVQARTFQIWIFVYLYKDSKEGPEYEDSPFGHLTEYSYLEVVKSGKTVSGCIWIYLFKFGGCRDLFI